MPHARGISSNSLRLQWSSGVNSFVWPPVPEPPTGGIPGAHIEALLDGAEEGLHVLRVV